MLPQEIIRRKRDSLPLSAEEIAAFVGGIASGAVTEGQVSAFAMAIFFRGMSRAEAVALTLAMRDSGDVLDWSDLPGPVTDKHSTGGVGDKTSLIIAPMVAACGVCVPMISGRGLGHTGGTLDKLESIPGYRVNLSTLEFRKTLDDVGYAMAGQTAELAPADKKMYALRDATSTVEAIPLIVASIISKKGAAGLGAMVIDVKVGNGAFMRDESRATALAHALVRTGNSCGIRTRALLTDMNQPLGRAVGNSLEVEECINLLRGEAHDGARPVLDLSIELSAHMLVLAGVAETVEQASERVNEVLQSGEALECLRNNIIAQGGDPRVCDSPGEFLPLVTESVKVESPRSGYINSVDTTEIGHTIAAIGGGRVRIEDVIDPTVGFIAECKIGDQVRAGETIGIVFCADSAKAQEATARIQGSYEISEQFSGEPLKLVKEVINE